MTSNVPPSVGITAAPAADQTVEHNGTKYKTVKEGLAYILVPKADDAPSDKKNRFIVEEKQKVFYNPIQQFNRDLTVLAIKAYGKEVIARKKERRALNLDKKRKRKDHNEENGRPAKAAKVDGEEKHDSAVDETSVSAAQPESVPAQESRGPGAAEINVEEKDVEMHEAREPSNGKTGKAAEVAEQGQADAPPKDHALRFTILDALSATGLRALRYAHEIPFVTSITANDILPSAVDTIKLNVQHNGLEDKIQVTQGDAAAHLHRIIASELERIPPNKATSKYDVIDLDPYGTAASFFDVAVQAVRDDGGLLCVTCTDAGVWASAGYPEKAFALYGGVPVKGPHCHEAGLRLILQAIATSAARYGLAIEPLLSLSIDFYARIFVRIRRSPASVKFLAGRTMLVYSCDDGCGAWTTQLLAKNKKAPNKKNDGFFYKFGLAQAPTAERNCEHCGSVMHLSGPMYGGPIHSAEFVQRVLDEVAAAPKDVYGTHERLEGMLQTALEELIVIPQPSAAAPEGEGTNSQEPDEARLASVDPHPFFFVPTALARAVHCVCPSEDALGGALQHLGYKVTRSHCKPGSMKTDAPWRVIWHIMRQWVKQRAPVHEDRLGELSRAFKILSGGRDVSAKNSGGSAGEQSGSMPKTGARANEKDIDLDKLEVVFDRKLRREGSKKDLLRYQRNPKENWGPMVRAKGS